VLKLWTIGDGLSDLYHLYLTHGKVIENTLHGIVCLKCRGVLGIVPLSGHGTIPELLFDKKQLIPALQQLLVSPS
jgi:hypothetical protein